MLKKGLKGLFPERVTSDFFLFNKREPNGDASCLEVIND